MTQRDESRIRGPKLKLKNSGITVAVKLIPTERKEFIPKPYIEKRSKETGRVLSNRQHIVDQDDNEIVGARVTRRLKNGDGKVYEDEKVVEYIDGEFSDPHMKTDVLELARLESSPDDFLYDDHYEVLPDEKAGIGRLWEIAKDIEANGPVYGPVVFRRGYDKKIAVITVEIDRDGGKFALLLRTTNSRVRLTDPCDIPQERSDDYEFLI